MSNLRAVLEREAAEVRTYDVGANVLRAARRRRRLRTVTSATAVVAVLAGMAGIFVTLRPEGPTLVAADRPATANALPWLPETVDSTVAEPPQLPTDRGVGKGALLYQPCNQPCAARLVAQDGTQYTLPKVAQMPPTVPRTATLSPDGRWLSYPDASGNYLLRDLTGTKTMPTANRRAVGWSSDSTWVGLADASSEDGVTVIKPPTETAAARSLPADDTRPLAGLTTAGAAVFGGSEAHEVGDPDIDLYLVDDAGKGRSVPVKMEGQLGSKEDLHSGKLIRTVDDETLLVQLMVQSDNETTQVPGDLFHIDAVSGEVMARIRLPQPLSRTTVQGETATTSKGETFRTLAAVVPDGVLLKVIRDGAPVSIELLDPATGDRSTIATFKGMVASAMVPGES
ncbi:hypothetical protein [Micromonospora sp. CPCC 206061]|uniref:hypothetical protein n=1 Tax=Micromonospora sp. CPCC 206061 TaxID=3122410 RepID=UPI002FEEA791